MRDANIPSSIAMLEKLPETKYERYNKTVYTQFTFLLTLLVLSFLNPFSSF
jgi:hypothetical protein